MKNIIVQSKKKDFGDVSQFLEKNFGFVELGKERSLSGFISPTQRIKIFFSDLLFVLSNLSKFSHANLLLAAGHIAFIIRFCVKFGLIKCNKFIWLGLLVHSERSFKIFNILMHLTRLKNEKFIVSSQCEVALYARKFNLPPSSFIYIPLGDYIDRSFNKVPTNMEGEYYFAGGYSNRNYEQLIEVFTRLDQQLLIVGSHLNPELNGDHYPSNITIMKDIKKDLFESLLVGAKACILPLKKDTGASGQRVINSYLRNGKAIIAKDMAITREYITHNQSGFLYKDTLTELPAIIRTIEDNPELLEEISQQSSAYYQETLTQPALRKHYEALIEEYSV